MEITSLPLSLLSTLREIHSIYYNGFLNSIRIIFGMLIFTIVLYEHQGLQNFRNQLKATYTKIHQGRIGQTIRGIRSNFPKKQFVYYQVGRITILIFLLLIIFNVVDNIAKPFFQSFNSFKRTFSQGAVRHPSPYIMFKGIPNKVLNNGQQLNALG